MDRIPITIWGCPAPSSFLKMRSWPTCAPSSRGFGNTGFRKQILLNGHGQEEVIPLALHQWAKKYQVPCILISLHWPTVIHDYLKDKAHGGPFETPFQHACEVEASYSLPYSLNSGTWNSPWTPSRKAFCPRPRG